MVIIVTFSEFQMGLLPNPHFYTFKRIVIFNIEEKHNVNSKTANFILHGLEIETCQRRDQNNFYLQEAFLVKEMSKIKKISPFALPVNSTAS